MQTPSYSAIGAMRKSGELKSQTPQPRRKKNTANVSAPLSKILRQSPGCVEPNKISVVEKYVTEVDPLPDRFLEVETLFLSHNSISTLAGFRQFKKLRVLSLACNCIEDFTEIESLVDFPGLQVLNLEGNPVTVMPNYRMHAIHRLPKLKMLDSKEVKPAEREVVVRAMKDEAEHLQLMFSNYFLQLKLEAMMQRIRMHAELMSVTHGRVSALNRAELPSATAIDTRKFLEYWDFEARIGVQERDHIFHILRLEVRRVKDDQKSKAETETASAYEIFKAIMSDGGDPSQTLKKNAPVPEWKLWDNAYKQVILSQQGSISKLLGELQEVKAENEARMHAMAAQTRAIAHIREEEERREKRAVRDREALIRELQEQVGSLEAATGISSASALSQSNLSPVRHVPSTTPAQRALPNRGLAFPNTPASARSRLPPPSASLSAAAAPRRSGGPTPSLEHDFRADADELVSSFGNMPAPTTPSAAPPPTRIPQPRSSSSRQTGAAARSRRSDADADDAPAPRMPPMPMQQAHGQPAAAGRSPGQAPPLLEHSRHSPPKATMLITTKIDPDRLSGAASASVVARQRTPAQSGRLLAAQDAGAAEEDVVEQEEQAEEGGQVAGGGGGARAMDDSWEAEEERRLRRGLEAAGQVRVSPATDVAGLQRQVELLQEDILGRVQEEERILQINEQLKQRIETVMQQNNENVEKAGSELERLAQELEDARASARAAMAANNNNVEKAERTLAKAEEEAVRRQEAMVEREVEKACKQQRVAIEKELRAKMEGELLARMQDQVEEEVQKEKEKVEAQAQESRKLLEARVRALQTMVDSMSAAEDSVEASLRQQAAELAEKSAQLEAALGATRADVKRLSAESAFANQKAEEYLQRLEQLEYAEDKSDRADDLRDLLLARRSLLRMAAGAKEQRRRRRVEEQVGEIGEGLRRRQGLWRWHRSVRVSQLERHLQQRRAAAALSTATGGGATQGMMAGLVAASGDARTAQSIAAREQHSVEGARSLSLAMQCAALAHHVAMAVDEQDRARATLVLFLRALAMAVQQRRVVRCKAALLSASVRARRAATLLRGLHAATQRREAKKSQSAMEPEQRTMRVWLRVWARESRARTRAASREREALLLRSWGCQSAAYRAELEASKAGGRMDAFRRAIADQHSRERIARAVVVRLQGAVWRAGEKRVRSIFEWRETLFRALVGWREGVRAARKSKGGADGARRMWGARLLALARGALHEWRRCQCAAAGARRRFEGMVRRNKNALVRKVWVVWAIEPAQAARTNFQETEEQLEMMRAEMKGNVDRANARDVENMELIEQIQTLTTACAQAEGKLQQHSQTEQELHVALEEASIVEQVAIQREGGRGGDSAIGEDPKRGRGGFSEPRNMTNMRAPRQ